MDRRKLIIIGSGPAGLTAAIYAARADLKPLVIAGSTFGGQLMTTTEVENFPGFVNGIVGPELMQAMMDQAQRFGAELLFDDVVSVDFGTKGAFKIRATGGEYIAESVILATGSTSRTLGLPSEQTFWGKGVSTCATCDGAFYRDKTVAVLGGGDSAMEEANFLTKFASKVYLIHRRDEFRASKIMLQRTLHNPKIEIMTDTVVTEILGDTKVRSLALQSKISGESSQLDVDGMFLAIGHVPSTQFLMDASGKSQVQLDELGYVLVDHDTQTSVEGVFVAGDVRDHRYRQAITAAGMGCQAALDVEKWLALQEDKQGN